MEQPFALTQPENLERTNTGAGGTCESHPRPSNNCTTCQPHLIISNGKKILQHIFLKKPALSKQGHNTRCQTGQRANFSPQCNYNWSASQYKITTRDLCLKDFGKNNIYLCQYYCKNPRCLIHFVLLVFLQFEIQFCVCGKMAFFYCIVLSLTVKK